MNISGDSLGGLDAAMEAVLTAGRRPSAVDFGGLATILSGHEAVARSHFALEFMSLVLDEADPDNAATATFAGDVGERLDSDFGINALVDMVADRRPMPEPAEARCFPRWLALAGNRDARVSVRTAALRGALLMKRQDPARGRHRTLPWRWPKARRSPPYLSRANYPSNFRRGSPARPSRT